jgi:ELWxxDGT repeat protein
VVNHTGDGAVQELTVYDGALYFSGGEGPFAPDRYLYRYDGLTVTKLDDIVTDDGSGYLPGNLTVYDGELYFMAAEPEHGRELWRFDGERAELVWDILPGAESSSAYSLQVHDEALYFAALSPDAGVELHSYQSPKP